MDKSCMEVTSEVTVIVPVVTHVEQWNARQYSAMLNLVSKWNRSSEASSVYIVARI